MAAETEHPGPMGQEEHDVEGEVVMSGRSTNRVRRASMEFSESIYGFMLVYPEICRVRYQTYWHPHVYLAGCLLFVNILLQVTLTQMTGLAILEENLNYRQSLLDDSNRYLMMQAPSLPVWSRDEIQQCCTGAACVGKKRICCHPNRSAAAGTAHSSLVSQGGFLTKPGGSGGKGKAKKASADGASGELSTSLCSVRVDGQIDCVQPAFILGDHWKELDTDGDGQWTREEAEGDFANLACIMGKGISTIQAFHNIVRGTRMYVEALKRNGLLDTTRFAKALGPAEQLDMEAVSERSFQLWRGVSALCSARDATRCGQLMMGGIFDGAISSGTRLERLVDLCQDMLKPKGICEKAHPVTFRVWRARAEQMCGASKIDVGWHVENPYRSHDSMDLPDVRYSMVNQFALAKSGRFQFFLLVIVFIWLVNMLSELQEITNVIDFVRKYPTSTDDAFNTEHMVASARRRSRAIIEGRAREAFNKLSDYEKSQTPRDHCGKIVITEISRTHKATIWVMIIVRVTLLFYLAWVGCVFTITTYNYVDLLMNAIALAFVFELPTSLFSLLVSSELKEALGEVQPFAWQTKRVAGPFGVFTKPNFYGLVVVPLIAGIVIFWNTHYNVQPVVEALDCACFQTGPNCVASGVLNQEWWNHYWERLEMH